MKILFVDDDAIARRSIPARIHWEDYGWEFLYAAKDGMEALEYMKTHQPDLILSDIKMPIMDGIQMAIIAKDYYPSVKFIFLSGYKDFEYAQQALKLNAIDYLTKPVMTETLISVLKKADAMIRQEQKINHVMELGYPAIRRQLLSQLMYTNFSQANDDVFRTFDVNLSNGFGTVGFIALKSIDSIDAEDLMKMLRSACRQFNELYYGSFFIAIDTAQLFFIFTANNTKNKNEFQLKTQKMQQRLNQWFEENLHIHGTFYYGTPFQQLNDLYLSYQNAQKVRSHQSTSLLDQIRSYIQSEYMNPDLTLQSIANQFNINHCYLTSLYKEQYGINLYDYLIQIRMEKAAELLHTTDLKSYQIAEMTGYNNSQYFSLSFKKYFGCTVTEYKHRNEY